MSDKMESVNDKSEDVTSKQIIVELDNAKAKNKLINKACESIKIKEIEIETRLKGLEEYHTQIKNIFDDLQNQIKTMVEQLKTTIINLSQEAVQNNAKSVGILNEINEVKNSIQNANNESQKFFGQINSLAGNSNVSFSKIQQLSEKAEAVDNKIKDYEQKLDKMQSKYTEYSTKIEDLLPGATSAGLAAAFEKRKEKYKWSIRFWTIVRFISIIGFIVFGIFIYKDAKEIIERLANQDFIELLKISGSWLINKFPFVIGLVLLEEYSRRTYNKYFKLEEEYAHKQILSQSFEGYKTQLSQLGVNQNANSSLNSLCENTIKAISESPLRHVIEEKEAGSRGLIKRLFPSLNKSTGLPKQT